VITTKGSLRRATNCYLGPDYPHGLIVWRLYEIFDQDEFVGNAAANGLQDIDIDAAERFLLSLGVYETPRLVLFDDGKDYRNFCNSVIEQLDYPRTVRGVSAKTSSDARQICREYQIQGVYIPDRFMLLLKDGDPTAVAAYLLSTGAPRIAEEVDSNASFHARVGSEQKVWPDLSIPIPNTVLFYLRDTAWIPTTNGSRRRPAQIMLSKQGVQILRGVYARYKFNLKDKLIEMHGGRVALESLLTRLGAATSLENLNGQSLYDLLLTLPERDPNGEVAQSIYRTLIESNVSADEL